MDNDIYAENILDHYSNPRNYGQPSSFDTMQREFNPLCGDEIKIFINLEKDIIKDIKFTGNGCAISQASASMLTEHIKNKNVKEVKSYGKEHILGLLGIDIGPVRLKCALLSLKAIKQAIQKLEDEQ